METGLRPFSGAEKSLFYSAPTEIGDEALATVGSVTKLLMVARKRLRHKAHGSDFHTFGTLPAGVGIFANWTAPLACEYVKVHFGASYSQRGMRDLFYRLRLSYTRPTYTPKKAAPEKQEAFREEFESLKNCCMFSFFLQSADTNGSPSCK